MRAIGIGGNVSGRSRDVLYVHKSSIGDRGFRHRTGGTTGLKTLYQRRVVPDLGWMVPSLQGFSQWQEVNFDPGVRLTKGSLHLEGRYRR